MIKSLIFRLLSVCLILNFCFSELAQAVEVHGFVVREPVLAPVGKVYELPKVLGYKINPANPLQIEFIVSKGNKTDDPQEDLMRSVNYFLAALTTSTEKIWVNLSPYETDRVIDTQLEATDIGRDLLSQDYILKQLAASLTNPNTDLGHDYWNNNHDMVDLSKIWISPDVAQVYDQENMVVITKASLKLESEDGRDNVLLPAITEEVNKGENFARLRQIYNSIILAQTFKTKFINSIYKHYINKGKINGVEIDDKTSKDRIYSLYLDAFKQGAYNITKKEYDTTLNRKVKRQYFSGGVKISSSLKIEVINKVSSVVEVLHDAYSMVVSLFERNMENAIVGNYKFTNDDDFYKESRFPILDDMLNTINARVLLIDESVIAREYIKLYLESTDLAHDVVEFENSADAEEFLANDIDVNFIIANDDKLLPYIRENLGDTMPVIIHSDKEKLDNFQHAQDDALELYSTEELFMEIYPGSKAEYDENYKFVINKLVKPRAAVNPIELEKQKEELALTKSLDKTGMINLLSNDENLTILFAEDDSGIRLSRSIALKRLGNTLIVAEDGLEAFDKASEILDNGGKIDAIVTDNQMPHMFGTQVLEELDKKYDISSIPKLIQSGTVKDDNLEAFGKDNGVLIYEKNEFMSELTKALKVKTQSSSLVVDNKQYVGLDAKHFPEKGHGLYKLDGSDESMAVLTTLLGRSISPNNLYFRIVNESIVLFSYELIDNIIYVDVYSSLSEKITVSQFRAIEKNVKKLVGVYSDDYTIHLEKNLVDDLIMRPLIKNSRTNKCIIAHEDKVNEIQQELISQTFAFVGSTSKEIKDYTVLSFLGFQMNSLRTYLTQSGMKNFDEQDSFMYQMIETLDDKKFHNYKNNIAKLTRSINHGIGVKMFSTDDVEVMLDEDINGLFLEVRMKLANLLHAENQSIRDLNLVRDKIDVKMNDILNNYAVLLNKSSNSEFATNFGITTSDEMNISDKKVDYKFAENAGRIFYDTSIISDGKLKLRYSKDYFSGSLNLAKHTITLEYSGQKNLSVEQYAAMKDFLRRIEYDYFNNRKEELHINLSDNLLVALGDLNKEKFQDVELDIFIEWLEVQKNISSSVVLDGGITMKSFRVEGMNESSLFDGLDINPILFENIKPNLVSFSQINDAERYLKN